MSGRACTKAEKRSVGSRAKCPICGKLARAEFRPFCSNACAEIDLGRWLGGRYTIPGEAATDMSEDEVGRVEGRAS